MPGLLHLRSDIVAGPYILDLFFVAGLDGRHGSVSERDNGSGPFRREIIGVFGVNAALVVLGPRRSVAGRWVARRPARTVASADLRKAEVGGANRVAVGS